MSNEFPLPDVGEGLTEADIVSWKVAAGDTVTVNQILVEIETAKSLVELPSPQAGLVDALLVEEGQTVEVGTPIIRFGGDGSSSGAASDGAAPGAAAGKTSGGAATKASGGAAEGGAAGADEDGGATLVGYGARAASSKRRPRRGATAPAPDAASSAPTQASAATAPAPTTAAQTVKSTASAAAPPEPATTSAGKPLAKPPVRRLAKDLGIDLGSIAPTGTRGEVTRDDVQAAAQRSGAAEEASTAVSADAGVASAGGGSTAELEERIPFKGVTKMMAKAMVDSAFTMPHVTEFLDVDVTATMDFVRRLKSTKFLGEDVKVSPLLLVAKAVTWAAARNPRINSCLEGDEIVVRKYVNLGIAAATPRGLIVPNIKISR